MRRVTVLIDRLVLKGIAGDQREAIARALREELGRTLAEPCAMGRLASLGHLHAVKSRRVDLTSDSGWDHLGVEIARCLDGDGKR